MDAFPAIPSPLAEDSCSVAPVQTLAWPETGMRVDTNVRPARAPIPPIEPPAPEAGEPGVTGDFIHPMAGFSETERDPRRQWQEQAAAIGMRWR